MKTKTDKQAVHFTYRYLLNPTNPVRVNLIGCGGTGSQVLTCLGRMHVSLLALGHTGLRVNVYDGDTVTEANKGRQLFADAEIGLNKAAALVNRINRFFGMDWKAVPSMYGRDTYRDATITLSCVDNVRTRYTIAGILKMARNSGYVHHPVYWMDFGNQQQTGQVLLSTLHVVEQPTSKQFKPVGELPSITDEFKLLLDEAVGDDTPSCSMAEALEKQDLFINSALAQMGCSLLWSLFRSGMTDTRGFFLNLKDFRSQPIKII